MNETLNQLRSDAHFWLTRANQEVKSVLPRQKDGKDYHPRAMGNPTKSIHPIVELD